MKTVRWMTRGAVAGASLLMLTPIAGASLIGANPSFEDDPVGTLAGPPTGWSFESFEASQTASYEIVTGSGVTDGAQAVRGSVTVDSALNGFTRGLKQNSTDAVQPDTGQAIPGMVQGDTYTVKGSLTPLSAGVLYQLQLQNSGPFFSTFEQFNFGEVDTSLNPELIGETIDYSFDFIYGGGPITYNLVLTDTSNNFTVRTMDFIADNLRIVPEPAGLSLAGLLLAAAASARRRQVR